MTVLFKDDFKLAPAGVLGSVHNPQTPQTGFATWTDPFSTPLETQLGVGAQYSGSFLITVESRLEGDATPYSLPTSYEIRSKAVGPTANDGRTLNYSFYFSDTTDPFGPQYAQINLRWNGGASPAVWRFSYSTVGGSSVIADFNDPTTSGGDTLPRTLDMRVEVTPTALRIYNHGTLIRTRTASFTWATNVYNMRLIFASMTSAPMTGYLVEDLQLTTFGHTDYVPPDLVIADAFHAHLAESSNATMFPDFPGDLPCVSRIDGFGMAINTSVIRTPFQAGNTRQRRLDTNLPKQFQFAWRCNNAQLHPLFTWLNIHGYDWFNIRLSGTESSALSAFATMVHVRLISDITVSLMQVHRQNWWILAATAEKYEGQ